MVQTDISQIASECSEWRQVLRNYRDEFQQNKKDLENLCRSKVSKEQMQEVEHFHNQFHIQLINIHDLKQEIKAHERTLQLQLSSHDSPNEELLARHEDLYDRFSTIEMTLLELRTDFQNFCSRVNC